MKIKKDNALINETSTMICPEMKKCLPLVMQYLDATVSCTNYMYNLPRYISISRMRPNRTFCFCMPRTHLEALAFISSRYWTKKNLSLIEMKLGSSCISQVTYPLIPRTFYKKSNVTA